MSMSNSPSENSDQPSDSKKNLENIHQSYWRSNLRLVFGCLIVWFSVSFGCGILFVEELNEIKLGGFKLGFWFAQQGSIYSFLVIIFFYAYRMNQLDKQFNVQE